MPTTDTQTHERFFTVVTKSWEALPAYLYGHTTIVRHVEDKEGRAHVLLRTEAGTDEAVSYLSSYQRDRLASGLHGVSGSFKTEADAINAHDAQWESSLGGDLLPKTIDHAALQEALRGPSEDPAFPTADAHPTSDRKGTIVYLGDASWLDINADGSLWFHPSSLGAATVVGRGGTTEEVFKAARLFVTQYSVWLQTHRLLTRLENDVPSGVAHYAVEGAKKALRELERKAYTIDYFYGS